MFEKANSSDECVVDSQVVVQTVARRPLDQTLVVRRNKTRWFVLLCGFRAFSGLVGPNVRTYQYSPVPGPGALRASKRVG